MTRRSLPGALALAALLVSCAALSENAVRAPVEPASPSPSAVQVTPASTPTPSPSPTRLPGSVVGLTVNGTSFPISEPVRASGELPTVVVLAFPFAVDRAGVERWIPSAAARTWVDDRTLRLSFGEADEQIQFKVPETRAAAGAEVIDWFMVNISFPDARLIRIFSTSDLTSGPRVPTASLSIRAPRGDGLTVAPDGRTAILYDGFGPDTGPAPTLFDLGSKTTSVLSQPPASDGWFSFADWLPDGRLVMVGRGVWVGDGRGASMRRIADAQAAVGGYPWVAVPDPAGKRLALWGYNADGHIAVVDLADGSVSRVTGPFRRSGADGAVWLVWSSDGTRIAGTDNDSETGQPTARVRIVDVAADRTLRTLDGNVYFVTGLATGELIVARDSGERGAGQRLLGLRTDFDLLEKGRYLGCSWSMSPDARYLIQGECGGAGMPGYTLLDLRGGASFSFGLPAPFGVPRWLRDGRLAYY